MLTNFVAADRVASYRASPHKSRIDLIGQRLIEQRYLPIVVAQHVREWLRLTTYLQARGLALPVHSRETDAKAYVVQRLCMGYSASRARFIRASVRIFLEADEGGRFRLRIGRVPRPVPSWLTTAVDEYVTFLRAHRGSASRTIAKHLWQLTRFAECVERVGVTSLEAVVPLHIQRFLTEDQPALFDGFLRAGVEFGGVTRDGVFDNPSTAVDKVLRGRHRKINAEFAAFTGSLAIDMQFAAPGKGHEKGGVEGTHGYVEDNFFRPIRGAASLEEINADLLALSRQDRLRRIVDGQTVADRLEAERAALRPLPAVLPRPCVPEHVRVTKFGEVRCRTNRYSVPTCFVGRPALIELFADSVRIIVGDELAAQHPRLFGRNAAMLDPLHYLGALKHKHRAVERAEVFNNARVPEALRTLLRRLVRRDRDTAGKQFLRVIELLEHHRLVDVVAAVERAAEHEVDDPAAIALLLNQRASLTPASLTSDQLPAAAQIEPPQAHLDSYVVAELTEVS